MHFFVYYVECYRKNALFYVACIDLYWLKSVGPTLIDLYFCLVFHSLLFKVPYAIVDPWLHL
jgi:hypothetical protein